MKFCITCIVLAYALVVAIVSCSHTPSSSASLESRIWWVYDSHKDSSGNWSPARAPSSSSSINPCDPLLNDINFIQYGWPAPSGAGSSYSNMANASSIANGLVDNISAINSKHGCGFDSKIYKLRQYLSEKLQ